MPGSPAISGQFGDLLDPRFQKIFNDKYKQLPDHLSKVYNFIGTNGRNNMTWSEVGAFADFSEFAGSISYDSPVQGFDTTSTPIEFASGFQVERKLFDDDQYNVMDRRPSGLATAAQRTRQKHGARLYNNGFSIDSYFYTRSEGTALCSNSHTTNAGGVDTSSGFDNLNTAALTAVAVAANRIQMVGFRDDRGNRISTMPSELVIPNALYEKAFEIVESRGKLDVATNNRNVHEGAYSIFEWNYLTDDNNWFMADASQQKEMVYWIDRIPLEFAFQEEFDTLVAKWRAYMRYSNAWIDWRWVIGNQVS
jgi:phage major head subunit gpT-like protein